MKAITALAAGVLIGTTITMLYAPKSGAETLTSLTDKVNNTIERGTARARQITRQTTEVAAKVKDQVQGIQDAVDAGVRAFRQARTHEMN